MTRINIDTLVTEAISDLREQGPALEAEIGELRAAFEREAAGSSKADLVAAIPGEVSSRATREQVVGAYVDAKVAETAPHLHLINLRAEARADRRIAQKINNILDEADAAQAEFLKKADGATFPSFAYDLSESADRICALTYAADYARTVIRELDKAPGADLRAVVVDQAKSAVYTMLRFPNNVLANGLSGATRGEWLYRSLGSGDFLFLVQSCYAGLPLRPVVLDIGDLGSF